MAQPTSYRIDDEAGVQWYFRKEKDDPLWSRVVQLLLKAGFLNDDLILPYELPRTFSVYDPDWNTVRALFLTKGDCLEFRRAVTVNLVRQQMKQQTEKESS